MKRLFTSLVTVALMGSLLASSVFADRSANQNQGHEPEISTDSQDFSGTYLPPNTNDEENIGITPMSKDGGNMQYPFSKMGDSTVVTLAAKMSFTIDHLSAYNSIRSKSSFRASNGYATLTVVQWSKGYGHPEVIYDIVDINGKSYDSKPLKGTFTDKSHTIGFHNLPTDRDLYVQIFNLHDHALAGNGYIN